MEKEEPALGAGKPKDAHVGTAAPGCPVERSSKVACHPCYVERTLLSAAFDFSHEEKKGTAEAVPIE